MGLWNLIRNLNNAEGIREAMRQSFDKHLRLAREGRAGNRDVTPLQVALFGAMASRFMVSGVEVTPEAQLIIWVDLGPFLWLAPEEAREAVAEYVVYKEMPADANIRWLTAIVQKGCAAGASEEWFQNLMVCASLNNVAWLLLYEGRGEEYFWA
ncbi:MAG TPA: hypothetical protein VMY42_18680 [Thermoguttaceae bacterium]|nr:hypothetical protein [Thermoguttaceae bacterium]